MSASPASRPPTPKLTTGLLLTLGLLSAVAPFATDLYLPAFPTMTAELSTSATTVQFTLTAFLLGITLGHLVFGPLSDRFGRRPPLLVGAVLCVVASAGAAFAPSIAVLIIARFLQGLSGAAGMVIGRAIISDVASGKAAARGFSLMMIVSGVAPIFAPLIGGFLTASIGWRGLLVIVLALAVAMLVAVVTVVRETQQRTATDDQPQQVRKRDVLLSRRYLAYTAVFGFCFAVMMAYISASPFVYQDLLGLTEVQYGIAFGVNALGLMGVSVLSAKLTATKPVTMLLGVGVTLMVIATVTFLALTLAGAPQITLVVPLFVVVSALGFVVGNATALALGEARAASGSASAILGALQFGLAAVVSPLVSLGGETSTLPLAIVMLTAALIAAAALLIAYPKPSPADHVEGPLPRP